MNPFSISWSYIKDKKLTTFLNTLLMALGIGIIVFLLLVQHQIQEKFTNDLKGIKMVVGAKGSPMQLILCNVYHIDNPTGNIPLKKAEEIAQNKMLVKSSIPLAVGDNHQGYRIIGTTLNYPTHYGGTLQTGKWWKKNMEVVIGADVAKKTKLKVGNRFFGAHGLIEDENLLHKEKKYKVTGILHPTNTVIDRLILTNIESVWEVHEHQEDTTKQEKEITALLITEYANTMAALMLPRQVNQIDILQAAMPALEINRIFNNIGIGEQILQTFAYIIIAIAALSVFVALYNALKERQYDLAIMRTLGASKFKLLTQTLLEGVLLAAFGGILGFLIGHGTVEFISGMDSVEDKIKLTGFIFLWKETAIILLIFGVGIIASIIPALQIYKIDISETLGQG